ncbi:bifunctional serine/threonine-protein kinase/formylglycine-generating enzyme family protein [Methylobacterium crusticola]|nr:bifunctional serine/threonine-protein kinase/formylglycine-generating enzyme family protein [Methylobacterium crusticola]
MPDTAFPAAAERRPGPGTRLNGVYAIEALVATGGMGEVYSGYALETGDRVAIKVIRGDMAESEHVLALFRKEAAALRRLRHAGIVRYYVFTTSPELRRPYLAMEFVEGESLLDVARRKPLTAADGLILLQRLAAALHAAHAVGVIHRDVSPDNIILPAGDAGSAKIIDFGIARSALDGGTLIGSDFAGKANYASPEQAGLFGGSVTARSDMYSLGLTLVAALLGRPADMGGTYVELVAKRRAVPDLEGVDGRLRPILRAMLQPRPEDRPADLAEVAGWAARAASRASAGPARRRTLALGAAGILAAALAAAHAPAWRPAATAPALPAAAPAAPQGAAVRPPEPPPPGRAAGAPDPKAGSFRDCARCPEMIRLAGGRFVMGGTASATERPPHAVGIAAFALGRHPVTVGEWKACVRDARCPAGPDGDDALPAYNLSWDDAQLYVTWLSAAAGVAYRLPSEAEWEFAARAGTRTRYWWGDAFRADHADCRECGPLAAAPARTGRLPENPYGLGEITGSVSQWLADCWVPSYRGAAADGSARVEGECRERVLRGGSWMTAADRLHLTGRESYDATIRYPGHGLRVARDLSPD